MEREPYNPGLSEEAWKRLHILVARLSLKYADKIKQSEELSYENEGKGPE